MPIQTLAVKKGEQKQSKTAALMISTIKPFKSNPRPRGPSLLLFIESDTRQDLCFQCPLKPTKRIMSGCVLGFRGSHSLPITTPLMGAASLWFTCIACVCVCGRGGENAAGNGVYLSSPPAPIRCHALSCQRRSPSWSCSPFLTPNHLIMTLQAPTLTHYCS